MKKIYLTVFIIIIGGMAVLIAGSKKPQEDPMEKIKSAPDTVKIGDHNLVLETYLWRDFMPISPPDGKPLKAVINIIPINAEKLPPDIDADKIWVFYEKKIWSEKLEHVGTMIPTETLPKLEKVAGGGPKWGPHVTVTVVVQLRDKEGKTFLLKADEQMIHRTD